MISDLQVLEAAYDLLLLHGVSRGAYARNVEGEVIGIHSKEAEQFNVVGAIARMKLKLTQDFTVEGLHPIFNLFSPYMDAGRITHWSDDADDNEVLSVIRSVINLERSRLADDLMPA